MKNEQDSNNERNENLKDFEKKMAEIRLLQLEANKLTLENTLSIFAEVKKLKAETSKLEVETKKIIKETVFYPFVVSGAFVGSVISLTILLTKLFLS